MKSENLMCIFRQQIMIRAEFVSDSAAICKFKGQIDMSSLDLFTLEISNDNGNTYSNIITIPIITLTP